jgi:peroxiredoxin
MTGIELLPEALPRRLQIGDPGPGFDGLLGVDGARYGLSSFGNRRLLVVIFSSNRCPTVKAYEGRLRALQDEYGPKGVQIVAINSNNPHLYPDETYDRMIEFARDSAYNFPYLMDREQSTGRAYGATRTFHVFVLDEGRTVRYQGRFDDSRIPARVTSNDLRDALEDLLGGQPVRTPETRPFGCSLDYVS